VSNVWETRNRLILEYLERLANQLRSGKPITPAELEEQLLRLLAGVLMSLRQHEVNKQGWCRICRWPRRNWRFWHRKPQCTVYRSLNFAMSQGIDQVWWQLLDSLDHEPT
jgi:hypothetical protein